MGDIISEVADYKPAGVLLTGKDDRQWFAPAQLDNPVLLGVLADYAARLRCALWYAGQGWRVVPLYRPLDGERGCYCGNPECDSIGKHPIPRHGAKDGSTNRAQILKWWTSYPFASVGICTGPESGLGVLDVDPKAGGEAALMALEDEHGRLPDTIEAITGSLGRHIFFRYPEGLQIPNSSSRIGPGLDFRAINGLVVAHPSPHVSGRRYAWEESSRPGEVELAEMPGWLVTLALTRRAQGQTGSAGRPLGEWTRILCEGAEKGSRNETLAALVGHLFRAYRGEMRAAAEIALMWNECRCKPPLSTSEVLTTIDSIRRKELDRRAANDTKKREREQRRHVRYDGGDEGLAGRDVLGPAEGAGEEGGVAGDAETRVSADDGSDTDGFGWEG